MTNKPLIKICGIKDPTMAAAAVAAGADHIGIIFHPPSPRHVSLEAAISIAQATQLAGAIPVAVFVDQTDSDMRSICEATNINVIQLHGEIARKHHHLLPDEVHRIYVQSPPSIDNDQLHYLDQHRDFLLIDHFHPGSGKTIDWMNFHYSLSFRWLLAGGLTPANVATAMTLLQPHGVDVSSGVESSIGNKDIGFIQTFIAAVKGHYAR